MPAKPLPIADPFESEEFHRGACAEFVCTVVADLYDVATFVSSQEDGLRFGEVLHEEIGVWPWDELWMHALFHSFYNGALCDFGTLLKSELCCFVAVVVLGCRIKEFPKLFKQAVLLLFAIAGA